MTAKEATARIKINKLLEAAGWHFFPEGGAQANIRLEPGVTIKTADLDALGENFEKSSKGFNAHPRKIRSYNEKEVFVGGELIEHDNNHWLEMADRVPVSQIG